MIIAIDFETFYSSKLGYTLKKQIAEEYCRHELFDPYMLSVYDGKESWVGNPRDFNWESLNGATLLAHNAYFETTVVGEMARRGWIPRIEPKEWLCTADMSAYLCNRRSLDEAAHHLLGIRVSKQARAEANGKRWKDFSPEEQKGMLEYAKFDTIYCWNLFNKHGDSWPAIERRLSKLTREQGQYGIAINLKLLEQYIYDAHEMLMATEEALPWIVGLPDDSEDEDAIIKGKPTSTLAIAAMCRKEGIPCQPVKSHDEEAYAIWIETYKDKYPWVRAVSSWRSVNKIYKSLLLLQRRIRPDGTMPFGLKYCGAHTRRWSGDANFNLQNQRKKPIFSDKNLLMLDDESKIDDALKAFKKTGEWPDYVERVIDFRKLVLPRPGKKMVVCDSAQIEPRVLAHLCGNQRLLDMISHGMSVYEAHARLTMGWTGGELRAENPELYQLAKIRVLGLGYGCGWEKFIAIAAGYGITLDETKSREIVTNFRASNPLIANKETGIWRRLEDVLYSSVGEDMIITLPSGNKLIYEGVKRAIRVEHDEVSGKPIRRHEILAGVGGVWKKQYGGLLTENLVQAVARDVFAFQLDRMTQAGLRCLFSVHDEAVMEVDPNVSPKEIEAHMSVCPEWLEGCPIGAEAKEVPHYVKA